MKITDPGWERRVSLKIIFAAMSALVVTAGPAQVLAKGDVERGRAIAIECFACHGKDGNAPSPINPKVGGQHEKYLVLALKEYRDGARKESLMRGAVLKMTSQDIEDVAAYYASQKNFAEAPPPKPGPQSAKASGPGGQAPAGPAGPGPGAFRVDKIERKATFVSLFAAAVSAGQQAKPLTASACANSNSADVSKDSDNDGLSDAFDLAPNDAAEFARDTNKDGRYEICSIQQLQAIVTLGSGDGKKTTLTSDDRLRRNYEIAQDLDAAAVENFTPIGSCGPDDNCMMARGKYGFMGVFDGRGHVIRNLKISLPQRGGVGLVGVLGETGIVMNLSVENATIEGRSGTGVVVGANMGTVYNTRANATVKAGLAVGGLVGGNSGLVALSSSGGELTAQQAAGGLVGDMTGGVYRSSSSVNVTGNRALGGLVGLSTFGMVFDSFATGIVKGTSDLGGLVGMSTDGSVNNSYASATVAGETNNIGGLVGFNSLSVVRNSYATGTVSGGDTVGGLVGRNNGVIKRSYAAAPVKGETNTNPLVGLTVEGEEKSTFANLSAPQGTGAVADLKTLDAEKSGWAPKVNISHDMLDFYCDSNFSGFIEPAERVAQNYIWSFDTAAAAPSLRCAKAN
ncbi:MAG: cytochrome c [Alphaproteobacteria bacterium]|nr:cytochrome c [Alphaproteobacteria bacterium]